VNFLNGALATEQKGLEDVLQGPKTDRFGARVACMGLQGLQGSRPPATTLFCKQTKVIANRIF